MNTLTEVWGPPGVGKTHTAIKGWPRPVVLDTAFTSLGFREADVDPDPDDRGESWPILLKLRDYDHEAAEEDYHYLSEWPEPPYEFATYPSTVIVDNAADLKVLAVRHWCEETGNDWPQQAQWGAVNDKIDRLLRRLKSKAHVVVISQMKDEYVNDAKTGEMERDGPKRMEFKADFRLEIDLDEEGDRHVRVRKNRHMDPAGGGEGSKGTDLGNRTGLVDLFALSGVPEEEWSL